MRARAVALMRISLFIKRGKAAYEADGVYLEFANPAAVADVFEDCVIPHAAAAAFAHFCIHAVRDFLYTDWVRPKFTLALVSKVRKMWRQLLDSS